MDYEKQAQVNLRRNWVSSAVNREHELIATASNLLQEATPDRNVDEGRACCSTAIRPRSTPSASFAPAPRRNHRANEGQVPDADELADIRSGLAAAAAALGGVTRLVPRCSPDGRTMPALP